MNRKFFLLSADHQRKFTPLIYSMRPEIRISWSSLPLKDLVQRLHKLTIEVLSECIRGFPSNGRPTINSRPRQKTCNGLANHIRARVNFLQSVGPSTVCDILLCYLPLSQPRDQPDELLDVDEAIGQSPTKKGPFTARHEEDGMGLEDMEEWIEIVAFLGALFVLARN
jgi:hypothetical protein